MFDIASASALCEAPEYEVMGLLVALAALQHLAALLINAIADAVPHGAAGAAHGQAAAVAKRMEAVMRHFIGTELACKGGRGGEGRGGEVHRMVRNGIKCDWASGGKHMRGPA